MLQPAGLVVISSCMDFPVHEYPADYWRFPPQGFDLLLERFSPRRVYLQGSPVFPHSLAGVGQKGGQDQKDEQEAAQALARLDRLVHTISGTLTQEISPRLGHDPFRPLGEDLAEEEYVHYPENMLHVAYDRLLQKDEEIQRLQNEVNRLLGELEQHAEAGQLERAAQSGAAEHEADAEQTSPSGDSQ